MTVTPTCSISCDYFPSDFRNSAQLNKSLFSNTFLSESQISTDNTDFTDILFIVFPLSESGFAGLKDIQDSRLKSFNQGK